MKPHSSQNIFIDIIVFDSHNNPMRKKTSLSISQMKKLRLKECLETVQSHTTIKQWS